ncbi:MAG TPA: hypothetical protein VGE72_24205 [Azospirillum sp.]
MKDEQLAREVRDAVAKLNEVLARAARQNLAVHLRTTVHQTTGGVEQVVVETKIFKQL